ncbi:GDP-mannose 4,6-dehydratase [Sphingobium rhizovicinum]|uniref:GDP-mannose 4,6-dehydratase n=1 Tax=Sphingobium rhizovicinum TaxID=432308 RepID=A0ABV7NB38_9SPHN
MGKPRTLITGGGGFTGRHLAALLAERGHEVHALVPAPDAGAIPHFDAVHAGNLVDRASVERIVDMVRPDNVVHLAAISFVAHGDVSEIYAANVVGTRLLLGALASLPTPPLSVLVASSANIHGNQGGCLTEDSPIMPANDYGVSKVATEMVCRLFADRLPIIVARPFNYTGLGQSPRFLIPKIVDHARRRAERIELGNIDVARDFSDVRTVVDAYARLMEAPAAIGGVFQLCSGKAVTLSEVLETVQSLAGHRMEVMVNPDFVRANDVAILYGDPARVEAVIGPLAHVPLTRTLRWMLDG